MSIAVISGRLAAFIVIAGFAASAGAAAQRTFVASTGNDANPCSRTQPCRGFATAVANTLSGGEVIVLDSAGYGPATIAQSITIAAPPGVYAGISVIVPGSAGINIDSPGITVALRGLSISGQGGWFGIWFKQGTRLTVENCEIAGIVNFGIYVTATNSLVNITDTVLRDDNYGLYVEAPATAVLDRVHVQDNAYRGVSVWTGSRVTVRDSVISGSQVGVEAVANFDTTTLVVARSVVTGHAAEAFRAIASDGASASILTDGNTVTNNPVVFSLQGMGSKWIYTAGNNAVGYYGTLVSGGSLTPCCAI